ncbi:hypothetical protein IJ384_05360 [bacterium]|nr:hypothetical protein [bacterium]
MSEDLSIKKQPSSMPYVLGGGLVGAAGGWVANEKIPAVKNYVTEPSKYGSLDDIVKEMDNKDKFESYVKDAAEEEKSFWEKAKQEKANIEKAGTDWDANKAKYIQEGTVAEVVDTDEIKELNKQLEAAQAKLAESEKALANASKTTESTVRLSRLETLDNEIAKIEVENKARKKVLEMQEAIKNLKNNKSAIEKKAKFEVKIPESKKYVEELNRFTEPVDPKYLTNNGKKIDANAARKSIQNKIQALKDAEVSLNKLIDLEATKLSKLSTKGDILKTATSNSEKEIEKFINKLQGLTKQQKADILAEAKIELSSRSGVMGHLESLEARLKEATAQYNRLSETTRNKYAGSNAERMEKLIAQQDKKTEILKQQREIAQRRKKHIQEMWSARKAYRKLEGKKMVDLTVKDTTSLQSGSFKYQSFVDTLTEADKDTYKAFRKATNKQVEQKIVPASDKTALTATVNADKSKVTELTTQIAEKRKALPKQATKSVEELTQEYITKNGSKADAIKKAQENAINNLKDDFANTMKKGGKNWIYWAAIGVTALAGSLLALAFKPSSKEA